VYIYITYSTGSGMLMRYTHYFNEIYVPGAYFVNLRHCTHLISVQKSVKSADFFDFISLLLYGQQVSYNCGIDQFQLLLI